ncbi:cortex morphogenetic protein CmpA [Peribacillus sp. FSL E2-0218]
MPNWFQNQIRKAFYEKDYHQVKMLNQCWFFYQRKESPGYIYPKKTPSN